MAEKKTSYTQLGMLFGIIIGGGIGVLLFVFTNNPLYFTGAGLGLVIGLILGAGYDRQKEKK
jgi:CDP-diglyceride synthetase